jgi:proline dehydrogenase
MSILKEPILKLSQSNQMRSFVTHNAIGRAAARRFVAGETLEDALAAAKELNKAKIHVSLDYLGENTNSEAEAEASTLATIASIDAVADRNLDANISIKLTAMGLDVDRRLGLANTCRILERARARGNIFVRLDMESSEYTQRTIDLFSELWNEGFRNTGVVLQSYLYRTEQDVRDMIKLGARVRLCKGAYLEPAAVAFPEKADTDKNYIKCMELLLLEGNYPGLATHDEKIISHALEFVKENKISLDRFEFQMLYGVRRDLQRKLVEDGYNVRAYVPFGSQWYPYLMRRMAERPANLLFIAGQFLRG